LHNRFERESAVHLPSYIVAQHDVPLLPLIGKLRNFRLNITQFCHSLPQTPEI